MGIRFLAISLLAASLSFAQQATASKTFNAQLAATGTTNAYFVDAQNHTLQVSVVSPATCTLRLEGSLDKVNWADLSGSQACTAATMFHVDGKSVAYVRVNLTAYSGDQVGAKVSVLYKGAN